MVFFLSRKVLGPPCGPLDDPGDRAFRLFPRRLLLLSFFCSRVLDATSRAFCPFEHVLGGAGLGAAGRPSTHGAGSGWSRAPALFLFAFSLPVALGPSHVFFGASPRFCGCRLHSSLAELGPSFIFADNLQPFSLAEDLSKAQLLFSPLPAFFFR